MSKDVAELNKISKVDFLEIYQTLCHKNWEWGFLSSAYRIFTTIDHISCSENFMNFKTFIKSTCLIQWNKAKNKTKTHSAWKLKKKKQPYLKWRKKSKQKLEY